MTDTCRAAVFLGDHAYEVREFTVPDPPPGGALLQVEAVGLCGSDVAQYEGIEIVPGASVFPVVPGHETVGIIEEVGKDVRSIKRGQFVVGSFAMSDNTCPNCRYGYQSSCVHREWMLRAQAPILRVPQADGHYHHAKQHSQAEHQEQPLCGPAARAGELAFAILQHALVGHRNLAKRPIEFSAPRHHLALEKCHLLLVGGM